MASLRVEIELRGGGRAEGMPSSRAAGGELDQADETGYSDVLVIDGRSVRLEDVVRFVLCSP